MESILAQFELDMMKNDHMYECALDKFVIKSAEIANMVHEGYFKESSSDEDAMYTEAAEDFIKAVKKWFDDMIEKVKMLVMEVISKIQAAQEAKRVKEYLKDAVKRMATDKSLVVNKKVKIRDTARYVKAYNGYIELVIKLSKELSSKKWDNYDEFEKANNEAEKKLVEYMEKNGLYNNERFELEMYVRDCVKWTEKELENQKSVTDAYWKKWKEALTITKEGAVKQEDQRVMSGLKSFASKITSTMSKGINKVASNENARKMINTIAAVAGYVAGKSSADGQSEVVKTLAGVATGTAAGVASDIALRATAKATGKNVDNDQTTAKNIDNDATSGDKN